MINLVSIIKFCQKLTIDTDLSVDPEIFRAVYFHAKYFSANNCITVRSYMFSLFNFYISQAVQITAKYSDLQ